MLREYCCSQLSRIPANGSFGDVRDLVNAQCRYTVLSEGREEAKGQGRFIFVCLNFSCVLIKYDLLHSYIYKCSDMCTHRLIY